MNEHDESEIREALKQSYSPVEVALRRDLWPMVLKKLDAGHVRVPWYDWALIGVSLSTVLASPQLILVFAYHL